MPLVRTLVVLITLCLTMTCVSTSPPKEKLTMEGFVKGHYSAKYVDGFWISGSNYLYKSNDGDAVVLDVSTMTETVILRADQLYDYPAYRFQSQSPDGNFLLINWFPERFYFASMLSFYTLYEISTVHFIPVKPSGLNQPKLMGFNWAHHGSAFGFVFDNNVYYVPNAGELSTRQPIQLTFDGIRDGPIFNAQPDYENDQITTFDGGPILFRFSPKSEYLTFLKYDDTDVDVRQVPLYGDASEAMSDNTYPKFRKLYWAMAGRPISKISVMFVNLTLPDLEIPTSVVAISYPAGNAELQERTGLPIWLDQERLQVLWTDRSGHSSLWYECDASFQFPVCSEVLHTVTPMEEMGKGYAGVTPLGDKKFFAVYPITVTHLKYMQVINVNRNNYEDYNPVTLQEFTVKGIIGLDEHNQNLYFYATGFYEEGKPDFSVHHVYKIPINGATPNEAECMSCNFVNSVGEACRSNVVKFSHDFSYIYHVCEGPGIPEIVIRSNDGIYGNIASLETNSELRETLSKFELPGQLEYTIPLPNSEFTARVFLRVPPNFDSSGQTKYPLLVDTYPNFVYPSIHRRFRIEPGHVLSGSKDVIVALIDGRSTIDQSWDSMASIYMNMGIVDIEDQLTTTAWLVEHLNFINPNHTAIWGESYGGYGTLGVLAKDENDIVKCGVAVASATSGLYLGSLNEGIFGGPPNAFTMEAYNRSSIWYSGVENFRNKKLLLLHSDSDLQAPFVQVMLLARELQKKNIMFDMMMYPNIGHFIPEPQDHVFNWMHYLTTLETFLLEKCFA